MLRHGIVNPPLSWREVNVGGVAGIWVTSDEDVDPDIVIYYLHGGGFSMGSPYFYLEFLIAYMNLLRPYYNNPAVFALDYTLVPYASHPTQLQQTIRGYDYVLSRTYKRASRICVAGDSAGATLVLSLLLHLAEQIEYCALRPGYATLISPWVTLVSDRNRDTKSDYLNANSLHLYGSQYAGKAENLSRPLVSPGLCTDPRAWARAAPTHGFYFAFGSEEVLGPEVRVLLRRLRDGKVNVVSREDPGGIHAWVVARLFLEDTKSERLKGIAEMVDAVRGAIKPTGLIGKVAQGIERGKVKTGEVKDGLWGRYII
ncbi:hypothetical protein MMC25_004257 [Agyrium rufum]|nr:hypothetical protein [Agyrium rufum]